MQNMRLVDVGSVPPLRSHAVYHALSAGNGDARRATLVLSVPTGSYVSLGFYQEVAEAADIGFCRERSIPIFRRHIGGGARLLGPGNLLFQTVFPRQGLGKSATRIYQEVLRVAVTTYRDFGVDAHYLPFTDIYVRQSRISAGALGSLDDSVVLASGIAYEADSELTRRALRGSSHGATTSMRQELGSAPKRDAVRGKLLENFEREFGVNLVPDSLTDEEMNAVERLETTFSGSEWLEQVDRRVAHVRNPGAGSERFRVVRGEHITGDGITVCATVRVVREAIEDLALTGDFLFYRDHLGELERSFRGINAEWDKLMTVAENFYLLRKVDSPGTTPADWANAVYNAVAGAHDGA